MKPMVESALAAATGAVLVSLYVRSAGRTAVRRQILAGISQLDQRFDRDRDTAIAAMPSQARQAIETEVGNALVEYHITPAQVRALVASVRQVGRSLPADIARRLSA